MHCNVAEANSVDKFIAFLDVLGWKSFVRKTEQNNNSSLKDAIDVLNMIKQEMLSRKELFLKNGSIICPSAPRIKDDIDFFFTMFSDNVVISTEVSPAGLVNLIDCCRTIYFKLIMRRGLMCRGYLGMGPIYHSKDYCVGSGLGDVASEEKRVSFSGIEAEERGTPFIEIDGSVIQFIDHKISDRCTVDLLEDIVKREGDIAAIFPFERLDPGKFGGVAHDPARARQDVAVVRKWIEDAKRLVAQHVDSRCASARRKGNCLTRILDNQLLVCEQTETLIEQMSEIFPAHSFEPENFPGLFHADPAARRRN